MLCLYYQGLKFNYVWLLYCNILDHPQIWGYRKITLFLKIHIILIVISHRNWNAIVYWHTANIYRLLKFCRLQKILLFTLNLTKGWFIIFALSVLQINNANCLKFSILQNPQTSHRNTNFNYFKNIYDIFCRSFKTIYIILFLSFQQSTWRRSC